jgi:hypothetical protein
MNGRLYRTYQEIRRMFPALVIAIAVIYLRRSGTIPANDPLMTMLHRLALGTLGFCTAHIVRQPAFPYLDLEEALRSRDSGRAIASAILVGLIYLGFIIGATLGL